MELLFVLEKMTGPQLAMLYKFLLSMYRQDEAESVYAAGIANCGAMEFCQEVARVK